VIVLMPFNKNLFSVRYQAEIFSRRKVGG